MALPRRARLADPGGSSRTRHPELLTSRLVKRQDMRNGQNNKRMRNRNNNHNNNNNRRGQKPMTRAFESNGPHIKIRYTALHVAEKYVQLAPDARSSGDPVATGKYSH